MNAVVCEHAMPLTIRPNIHDTNELFFSLRYNPKWVMGPELMAFSSLKTSPRCLVKVFFAIEKWLKTVYNLTSLRINVVFRVSCPCTRTCHRTSYEQTLISLSFSCGRRQTPSYGRTTSNASANTWNAHSNTMSSVARANDIGPCVSVQWKLCHTRNSHLRYFFSYSHHQ